MRTGQLSVATTPTKVVSQAGNDRLVYLHNEVAASYVGNSVVTTTTGMKLDTNDKITLTVRAGDELWIVGGGTSTLTFMEN